MTDHLLHSEWITRLQQHQTLIVGFSGGLDSTVLVHLLSQQTTLRARVLAVYINHGLSEHALSWQQHAHDFCATHGIAFQAHNVTFKRTANIEEEARLARYAVFSKLVGANDCLLLGHHVNDQAETLLLRVMRGAGVDGLAAMSDWRSFSSGMLARPLLSCTREQLSDYARLHQLHWIEDESNQDCDYSRNYIRHQVMPLLTARWPNAVNHLARTASHCQSAQKNLEDLALQDCGELEGASKTLRLSSLTGLNAARQANVLRVWFKKNNIQAPATVVLDRIIHEIIGASMDATPLVQWQDVWVRRYQDRLYLGYLSQPVFSSAACLWTDFPNPLVWQQKQTIHPYPATQGVRIPPSAQLVVRTRQGGERLFFRGQNKSLKKLLQEWHVPPWLREEIPLLYINETLAVVIGYAVGDHFYTSTEPAWDIVLV